MATLAAVGLNNGTLQAHRPATVMVSLDAPAGPGGVSVSLTYSPSTGLESAPSGITVPQGQTMYGAGFYTGSSPGAGTTVTASATQGSNHKSGQAAWAD